MKVEVKKVFRDKITGQLYQVGAVVDFDDQQRVDDMVARGLVEVVSEVVVEVVQPTPKRTKPTK